MIPASIKPIRLEKKLRGLLNWLCFLNPTSCWHVVKLQQSLALPLVRLLRQVQYHIRQVRTLTKLTRHTTFQHALSTLTSVKHRNIISLSSNRLWRLNFRIIITSFVTKHNRWSPKCISILYKHVHYCSIHQSIHLMNSMSHIDPSFIENKCLVRILAYCLCAYFLSISCIFCFTCSFSMLPP